MQNLFVKNKNISNTVLTGYVPPELRVCPYLCIKPLPSPPPPPPAHMHALANNRWIQSMTVLHSLITNFARSFLDFASLCLCIKN
jgi:hypothetical protein